MKLHRYSLSVFLFLLFFSASGFTGEEVPCPESPPAEAPQNTPSTPSDSGPSGGEGFGTVGDQLGQTFDPNDPKAGGGGMGPTVFNAGSDKDLLKKFPKDSPEWKDLKKSEHQVKADKENANHVESVDKVSESKDHYDDAIKAGMEAR